MFNNTLTARLFIFTLLFICTVSCKKDKTEKPDVEEPPIEEPISLARSSGTPGDLITVKTALVKNKDNWQITAGGKKIPLVKVSDSTAVFLVPYIASGGIKIDFSDMGISSPVDFTISQYLPVSNPEMVLTDFESMLDLEISTNEFPDIIKTLTALKANLNAGFKTLTEQEKKELAFQLQKFNSDVSFKPAIASGTNKISFAGNKQANSLIPSFLEIQVNRNISSNDEYVESVIQCGALLALSGSTLLLGVGMFAAPTGVTQLTGAALLGYTFYVYSKFLTCKRGLFLYPGENREVRSFNILGSLTNKVMLQSKTSSKGNLPISVAGNSAATMVLSKDYAYAVEVKGSFGALSSTSSSVVVQKMIAAVKAFGVTYNKGIAAVNASKNWFVPTPDFPPYEHGIPESTNEVLKVFLVKNLKIEKISDPAITIAQSGTGSNLLLTASSKSVAVEKEFTFDVVYQNPGLEIINRKTISAIYDPNVYPEKIEIVSGNNQNAEPGKKLSNPLKIIAKDASGKAVEGVIVTWKVKSGSGVLSAANSTTGVNGMAETEWTLGATGSQEVEATVRKRDGSMVGGSPLLFKTSGINILGKWRIFSQEWKKYSPAGVFLETDPGDPFNRIEFKADFKVILSDDDGDDTDEGTYVLDPAGKFVTISGTNDDDFTFKYHIADVSADGMVLTTDKIYDYFNEPGYGILELKLKK